MGSFARHPQYLLVADETAIASLEAMIATLPLCASGRIFVEVGDGDQVSRLDAPSRMSVTWLVRSQRSGEAGTGLACSRGQAASRAVAAWCSEMFPDADADADAAGVRLSSAWLGGDYRLVSSAYEVLVEESGVDADLVDAPADFGLRRR
ncbi:hypothetical protein FM119_09290 [Mycetocola reblochoni REB411]|uniref:SIP-like Rossmann fold domain-containing protein n=1 Tax=Mycetocola reblochoni REB411 TaxID=1255698 RepID=A0A1R4JSX7_9MICO|nr:hypothetical protein FM119_09290 [Mycetocola reblochoni REB411]